jgi:hypothetical protein
MADVIAARDSAFSLPVTLDGDDVVPCYYNPPNIPVASQTYRTQCAGDGLSPAATVSWTSAAPAPNAVRVTATRTGAPMTLGGMFRSGGPTVSSGRAYAWIANIQSGKCIKPWAMPYSVLFDGIGTGTGLWPASYSSAAPTFPRPDLTQSMVAALTNLSVASRTVVMRGPTVSATTSLPAGASPANPFPDPYQWYGYSFAGNSGQTWYQAAIWNCDDNVATVGTTYAGNTITAGGTGGVECWTVNALAGNPSNPCNINGSGNYLTATPSQPVTCYFKAPIVTGSGTAQTQAVDAGCYPSASSSTIGVTNYVAWGDYTGTGSNAVKYRVISKFVIACVFRAFVKDGSPFTTAYPQGTTTETCAVPGGTTYTNMPVGTIVGVILPISSESLSPTTVVGNATSIGQRLILVSWPN